MRVVVTGASGYLGRKLLQTLLDAGDTLDLIIRPSARPFLTPSSSCQFHKIDLERDLLEPLFGQADAVVHLASHTDPAGSFENRQSLSQNLQVTQRVSEACVQNGKRLIFLSTTSVYGSLSTEEISEDCGSAKLNPQSPYAETKLAEEGLLQRAENLSVVILRCATVFGCSPRMHYRTAIPKFCREAVFRSRITVWQTAMNQKRPYLDITDACEAIAFVLHRNNLQDVVYNVLTTNATVREVLAILSGQVPQLSFDLVKSQAMNHFSFPVSNERFRRLGFTFRGSLTRGIREMMEYLWQLRRSMYPDVEKIAPRVISKDHGAVSVV